MEYVIAVIILGVLGFCVWIGLRFYDAGQEKKAASDMRAANKARRKGDAVMAEPTADESDWLARQRRLHRMQDKPDA